MIGGGAVGGAPWQGPEEAFELPTFYDGVGALERGRQKSARTPEFEQRAESVLSHRRANVADYAVQVATAMPSSDYVPDPASVLAGVDVVDLAVLTPLQAALVESALDPRRIFGVSVIDLWVRGRGLAFAFEAFIEYCHVMGFGADGVLSSSMDGLRLLEFVRSAPDAEHAEVAAVADRVRRNKPSAVTRALTTFLFPQRPDWFWADFVAVRNGMLAVTALLPSVSTADQAAALAEHFGELPEWQWNGDPRIELALLGIAGPAMLPFLIAWCDNGHECPPPRAGQPPRCPIHRRCLELMARIPNEAALSALVRHVEADGAREYLQAAMNRFPRRALRVLAESGPSEEITRLLTMSALADPDVARAEAQRLSPGARERIEAVLGEAAPAVVPTGLPQVLAAPPWRDKKRQRVKPVVIEGLTAPAEVTVAWLPGEREAWLTAHGAGWTPEQGWESVLPGILDGTGEESLATYFAAYAPEELVRPQLSDWQPPMRQVTDRARTFVAKYEHLALPTVLSMTRFPAVRAQLLQPFRSPEIAAIMADGLARLRSVRGHAIAWLRRHPEDAVRALVPTALGKPGKLRQNTVAALRLLEGGGVDVVTIGQLAYGEDAATAIKEVLADRGLDAWPRTVPTAPLWARAVLLAEIRLKDGHVPLPSDAAQAVVEMLMFSKPDAPYPGLEIVKEVCDASSLTEFAWSLHQAWEEAGAPEKESWVIGALGVFGDENTVTRLEKLIRDWHAQSRPEHVYAGFDALAAIGGDRALVALYTFSRRSWTPKTKRKAQATFEDVAQSMDLTADRLADRLVPTSGLSAGGTHHLDYGRRSFAVSFDELLRPVITDETGAVLRTLPKPGKRDDPELAPAAFKDFATLRRQVRDSAQEQTVRLERAMLERRRWLPEEFAAYLVGHLVLGRLVRRLVWGVYAEDGRLLGSFRVAEDLSFADVDDADYEVPDGAVVGVAHPVDLGPALGRWSEVFSDYEILQPFDQLGRPPLELSAEDRAGRRLVRAYISPNASTHGVGGETRFGPARFVALLSRGWQPGPIGADRLVARLLWPVGAGRHVVMELDPGLEAGAVALSEYQAVKAVWLSATGEDPDFERHALPLSELDEVSASVVLRDLQEGI